MSQTPKFRIQPRDVCPGDYYKYQESDHMKYSNYALNFLKDLNNLMSQYIHRKEINKLVEGDIKKLEKRHEKVEKQYNQVRNYFFTLQKEIFLLSNSLGRITQKRELIDARNKEINKELSYDSIKNQMEKINVQTIDNKTKSQNLNKFLDEQKEKLEEIRQKYFSDYNDENYFFNAVKTELQKRRLENDKLLNEIDQNNRRLLADSINRTNLMKL